MGFGEAIGAFYKRAFDFQGRSRRSEYWWSQLYLVLLVIGLFLIVGMVDESTPSNMLTVTLIFIPFGLAAIFHFVPMVSQTVRRFHDQDLSGFLYFLSFIPYVGNFIMLYFMVQRGTAGPNRFGDDPKGFIDIDTF